MSYDNPFADTNAATNPYAGYEPPVARTSLSPSSPSSGSTPAWAGTNSKDLDMKEESLRRREQELLRREQELDNRERQMRDGGMKRARPPNWPAWPKSVVHQNIDADIKDLGLRSLVRKAFYGWHVLCFIMVWNLVAMTGILAVRNVPGDFILAIVYFLIWLPLTFLYYRNLYNAARTGRVLQYYFFFFFCGFQILCHIFWGLGVVGSGMAGFLWMLNLFSGNSPSEKIVGIFCLVGCILWWLMAAFNIYTWIHARMFYVRNAAAGGNAKQAEREFAQVAGSTIANNPETAMRAGQYAVSKA